MNKEIDDYLRNFNGQSLGHLNTMRALLSKLIPEAKEVISYGIPTLKLKQNIVHFGGFAHHTGFYPGAETIRFFSRQFEKAGFKFAKGSVQFPYNQPLPVKLITEMVTYRLQLYHNKFAKK